MNRVKSATLNGKRWRFDWRKPRASEEALALCHEDQHRIQIDPNLDDETTLAALIDEVTHAHFPCLDNDAVDAFSDDLARLLKRIGYTADED